MKTGAKIFKQKRIRTEEVGTQIERLKLAEKIKNREIFKEDFVIFA